MTVATSGFRKRPTSVYFKNPSEDCSIWTVRDSSFFGFLRSLAIIHLQILEHQKLILSWNHYRIVDHHNLKTRLNCKQDFDPYFLEYRNHVILQEDQWYNTFRVFSLSENVCLSAWPIRMASGNSTGQFWICLDIGIIWFRLGQICVCFEVKIFSVSDFSQKFYN